MYRYVEIDLTRGADDVCSSYTIGRDGENLATALKVILPDKFVNSNIIFEFKMSDDSAYSSKMIPYNEEIIYEIQDFLMIEGLMTISIVAIDSTTGAVVKPFQKNFIVSSSTGVLPSQGIPYGVADDHNKRIESLENTSEEMQKKSHEHSNKDLLDKFSETDEGVLYDGKSFGDSAYEIAVKNGFVGTESEWIESMSFANQDVLNKLGETNGNLTYKGREVGSCGSGGSGGKDEIYIGSGEMPEGYIMQIDPDCTSPSILPSVTEADNGKVLRVVDGVWAADTILIEQNKSNWELITEVALDTETAKYILCSCDEYDKVEIIIKRELNNTSLTGNMFFEIVDSNGNSVVELYSNNTPGYREKLTIMEVNSGYAHCIAMTSNNYSNVGAAFSRGYYVGNGCKYCLKIPKPDTACDGLSTMTVIGRRL